MSSTWHESQSDHNKDVYDILQVGGPNHPDWKITPLFYAALHLIDGILRETG